MKLLILLIASIAIAQCVMYATVTTYQGAGCTASKAIKQVATKVTTTALCPNVDCQDIVGGTSAKTECLTSVPKGFGVVKSTYSKGSGCQGDPTTVTSTPTDFCERPLGIIGDYVIETCVNGNTQTQAYTDDTCTVKKGNFTEKITNGTCITGILSDSTEVCTGTFAGGNICFHHETMITYKGQVLGLSQLKKNHPECHIPHMVRSKGVVISHTCNDEKLRLTDNHLVVTRKHGQTVMIAAGEMRKGDLLFKDMEEKNFCRVTHIEKEEHVQEYFGLNCVESVVLANGVKTSTFGVVHRLPALWMKYMSKIMGPHRASQIGDKISGLAHSLKLL